MNQANHFGIKKADGSLRRYIVLPNSGSSYTVWDRNDKVATANYRRLDKALAMMRTLNKEGN